VPAAGPVSDSNGKTTAWVDSIMQALILRERIWNAIVTPQ
jgi:hypothetical protein